MSRESVTVYLHFLNIHSATVLAVCARKYQLVSIMYAVLYGADLLIHDHTEIFNAIKVGVLTM